MAADTPEDKNREPGTDRFVLGHPKLPGAGGWKGTPNNPMSLKVGLKKFGEEDGQVCLEYLRHVMYQLPDYEVVETGEGKGAVLNNRKLKLDVARLGAEYNIGLPPKAQPDRQLIMEMIAPPGVDPFDLKKFQAWKQARDRVRQGLPRQADQPPAPVPKPHPGGSLVRDMQRIANAEREAAMPQPKTVMVNGQPLEVVQDHELPEIYDPTRRGSDE